MSFFINGYYFYLYFQGSARSARGARRQRRHNSLCMRLQRPPRSRPSHASPTVQSQQTLTKHPPCPSLLPPPPEKKLKEDTYNFTKDQEIGIAAWLSENDWLWKQGVSILFIILLIYMFIIGILLNVASLLCILPAPYYFIKD